MGMWGSELDWKETQASFGIANVKVLSHGLFLRIRFEDPPLKATTALHSESEEHDHPVRSPELYHWAIPAPKDSLSSYQFSPAGHKWFSSYRYHNN
jgi:hypothetical protein